MVVWVHSCSERRCHAERSSLPGGDATLQELRNSTVTSGNYHALLLVTKGYSYRQTAEILFVDEETISRWVQAYQEKGLEGLKNHPRWGGEHGQRRLNQAELEQLGKLLEQEAMPGTEVGSG